MRGFGIATFAIFLAISGATGAHAQEASEAVLLASVDIYEAQVLSVEGFDVNVSFDLHNGVGVQPGVRYAVYLFEERDGDTAFVDALAYDETLVLGPGETVHKTVPYTAPSYLKGDYQVWVASESTKGLPLGQGFAGQVTLKGDGAYVEVALDSCELLIEGEDEPFALVQGVDIAPHETLMLSCSVKNHFDTAVRLTPSLDTYRRSIFGEHISDDADETHAFELKAGEERNVLLPLPIVKEPQAYDVVVTLGTEEGPVSNAVIAHYVLQGESGTLQNVRIDREAYNAGDAARVTVDWSGRADGFADARQEPVDEQETFAEIVLSDASGELCAEPYKTKFSPSGMNEEVLSVPITKQCEDVSARIVLADHAGNVLDMTEFNVNGGPVAIAPTKEEPGTGPSPRTTVIVLGLIIATATAIFIIRLRSRKDGLSIFFIFCAASATFFLLFTGSAEASTFMVPTSCHEGGWTNAVYTVNMNKGQYAPGEQMVITTAANQVAACGNKDWKASLYASFDRTFSGAEGEGADMRLMDIDYNTKKKKKDSYYRKRYDPKVLTRNAPAVPGAHYIYVLGGVYAPPGTSSECHYFGLSRRYPHYIHYTVASPRYTLWVAAEKAGGGEGGGVITTIPASNIRCTYGGDRTVGIGTCHAVFDAGTRVQIVATPSNGYRNGAWGNHPWAAACASVGSSSRPCTVTMSSELGATATFEPGPQHILRVTVTGAGGAVVSAPEGVNCPSGTCCTASFPAGTSVHLWAEMDRRATPLSWGGACLGNITDNNPCGIIMDEDKDVSAGFASELLECSCDTPECNSKCRSEDCIGNCDQACKGTKFCPFIKEIIPW